MSRQTELLAAAESSLLGNYKPQPIVLSHGAGRRVTDVDGRTYLDFIGGIAVTAIGHAHPALVRAVADQAARLITVSNHAYNERAIELAAELTRRTGFARAFFCNSGAEANEALLKLARNHHYLRGDVERTEFITFENGFHGRTYGALSVTAQPKYHVGMGPMLPGARYLPFGDLAALEAAIGPRTAAVLLEPIQAEGGINVASDDYLHGIRAACDRAGALLFFDEVQTGFGRTGRFLAREYADLRVDACSLAKAIAGGVPLGAVLVSEPLIGSLPPGTHGTTFGGNALACAAALAVLRVLDEEGLVEHAARMGEVLEARLRDLAARFPTAVEGVRGRGLLLGLVLTERVDPADFVRACREANLLLTVVGSRVVRFVPALNVTPSEIDEAVEVVARVLSSRV